MTKARRRADGATWLAWALILEGWLWCWHRWGGAQRHHWDVPLFGMIVVRWQMEVWFELAWTLAEADWLVIAEAWPKPPASVGAIVEAALASGQLRTTHYRSLGCMMVDWGVTVRVGALTCAMWACSVLYVGSRVRLNPLAREIAQEP